MRVELPLLEQLHQRDLVGHGLEQMLVAVALDLLERELHLPLAVEHMVDPPLAALAQAAQDLVPLGPREMACFLVAHRVPRPGSIPKDTLRSPPRSTPWI